MCVGIKTEWDENGSASFEYCFVFAWVTYFLKVNNLFTGKIKTNVRPQSSVFCLLPDAVRRK